MSGQIHRESFAPSAFLGFALGLMVVAGSVQLGDDLFRPAPALAFVLIGAMVSVWLAHGPSDILRVLRLAVRTLYRRTVPVGLWVEYMCAVGWLFHTGGLLALEPILEKIPEPLLRQRLLFFVDGVEKEVSERILENRTAAMDEQQRNDQALMTTAGAGTTLFGVWALVLGLGSDQPPTAAFLPLWWGIIAVGLLYALRAKLRRLDAARQQQQRILAGAIDAIQEGDNPHMIHIRLNMFLPPTRRLSLEDMKRRLGV